MTNTEKRIKKQKIKETIKHILHILCYVLSVAFIILMVIVCAQNCSNNKNNVATENKPLESRLRIKKAIQYDDYKVYEPIYSGAVSIDIDDLMNYQTIPTGLGGFSSDIVRYHAMPDNTYLVVNGISHKVANLSTYYTHKEFTENGDDYYVLVYAYFYYENGGGDFFVNLRNDDVNDATYTTRLQPLTFETARLVFGNEVDDDELFKFFFKEVESNDFIFNKDFNFNAPIGLSIDNYYGGDISLAPITIAGGIYRYKYETGYFISNNVLYNGIVADYLNSGACHYLINSILTLGQSDGLSYNALGFIRADNGLIDFVNYRNTSQYMVSGGSPTSYYLNSSTWINDAFRKVTFLQELSESLNVKINAFNNNNQNTIDGYIGSSQVTDVFTLVGSAFTSILPVLNIMVLPGITLGILLFIPLVAMLVFAIIRIIKK